MSIHYLRLAYLIFVKPKWVDRLVLDFATRQHVHIVIVSRETRAKALPTLELSWRNVMNKIVLFH